MSYQHKELAAGRWQELTFAEQMANIGSEVERAVNWRSRNNSDYARRAAERALELADLTIGAAKGFPRLKELTRMREAIVDDFFGENSFHSTDAAWRSYFLAFTFAARRTR